MTNVTVYRVIDYATVPSKPLLSVVSDGKSATYVYSDHVEYSSDPNSAPARYAEEADSQPETPIDWLNLVLSGGAYYGYEELVVDSRATMDSAIAQEQAALESGASVREAQGGKERQLSDNISELLQDSPDLSNLFATGTADTEPEQMRDFVRMILEENDALDLNPGLAGWLAGGEPPSPEEFDGLIFWPETGAPNA